jgi:hypothetical protein
MSTIVPSQKVIMAEPNLTVFLTNRNTNIALQELVLGLGQNQINYQNVQHRHCRSTALPK